MLDIALIQENPDLVAEKLARRGFEVDFDEFLSRDRVRRDLIYQTEQLKAEKNKTSAAIPLMKREGQDTTAVMARMKAIGEKSKTATGNLPSSKNSNRSFSMPCPIYPPMMLWPAGKQSGLSEPSAPPLCLISRPSIMWIWPKDWG